MKGTGVSLRTSLMLSFLILAGCAPVAPTPSPRQPPLVTAEQPIVQPPPPTKTLAPTWTPTPHVATATPMPTRARPVRISLEPAAPAVLGELADNLVAKRPTEFTWAEGDQDVSLGYGAALPLGQWVFVAVAPFPTVTDGVAWADVEAAWSGEASGPMAGRPFLASPSAAAALEAQLGQPAAKEVQVLAEGLIEAAWAQRSAWAVVAFDELEPRWKVLRVEGISPLDKPLDLEDYPLAILVGVKGPLETAEKVWVALGGSTAGLTNRDESKLTVVAMTGVTALVRATAYEMEIRGMTYPGEEVAAVLLPADIAHVSNEIAFAADCPFPNPSRQESNLKFCSREGYIELLESIGTDVVELTGNHVNDWGTTAFSQTLSMYQERGWGTFGGGANAAEATEPLIMTHNGNTIGFVGCNPTGPQLAWATEVSPGAAACTLESLAAQVTELASQVDVVVVGIQYYEHYAYAPTTKQQDDFLTLAAAGGSIVSGSQGHHAQGFAFDQAGSSLVHFGLGNLFFDQMDRLGTRQTFVDRHVIYDGRYIATDLWTGLIEGFARPRSMTDSERTALLESVFAASGW